MGQKYIWLGLAGLVAPLLLVFSSTALAQSSSTNYMVNEYFFGSGGELEACSDAYCSKQSAGETAVGNTSSNLYDAQAGFNTTDEPVLEVMTSGSVDFGVLSANETKSGSVAVQVRTYLASGYTMRITGPAPTMSSNEETHSLISPSTPTAPAAGTEQFGVNLRANNTPSVGADPVQVPDSSFSFGLLTTDYNTPDLYMYSDGAPVAYSDSSSGQTNYTVSMIANMSNLTPAGKYTTNLSVVVTSTF